MTVKILQRVFPLEGHFGNLIFHQKIQKVFGRPFCKIVFYVFFFMMENKTVQSKNNNNNKRLLDVLRL